LIKLLPYILFQKVYSYFSVGNSQLGTSTVRVHSVIEKSLKMLEFGIKTSRPLKVLEKR